MPSATELHRTTLDRPGVHKGPDVALWDPQVRSDALSGFALSQRRISLDPKPPMTDDEAQAEAQRIANAQGQYITYSARPGAKLIHAFPQRRGENVPVPVVGQPVAKTMPVGTIKCVICDNTGYADYAGFAMDVCPCQDTDETPAQAVNPKELAGAKKPASWSVMPRWVALQVGRVMSVGAAKYGAFNYRETPIAASTYQDALERHLALWFDGEDNDAETGVSHLASAIASCTLLMDAQATGQLLDDRQKTGIVRRTLDALEALLVSLPLPAPKTA
jgi:hypothetical protein